MKTDQLHSVLERIRLGKNIYLADRLEALEELAAIDAHFGTIIVRRPSVQPPTGEQTLGTAKSAIQLPDGAKPILETSAGPAKDAGKEKSALEKEKEEISKVVGVPVEQVHAMNAPPADPVGAIPAAPGEVPMSSKEMEAKAQLESAKAVFDDPKPKSEIAKDK